MDPGVGVTSPLPPLIPCRLFYRLPCPVRSLSRSLARLSLPLHSFFSSPNCLALGQRRCLAGISARDTVAWFFDGSGFPCHGRSLRLSPGRSVAGCSTHGPWTSCLPFLLFLFIQPSPVADRAGNFSPLIERLGGNPHPPWPFLSGPSASFRGRVLHGLSRLASSSPSRLSPQSFTETSNLPLDPVRGSPADSLCSPDNCHAAVSSMGSHPRPCLDQP